MKRAAALLWLLAAGADAAAQSPGLTEKDFLGELPVVFTVSRLPQPLNEAPGAVTVIDRDLIRRSGARELVDVLRLVPGFTVTYARGGNGLAAYHGANFDLTPRMQVLIDGRAVYSVHYVGGTSFGMRTVALEDIERIEILRGSNSANYGARAFLGVVNIITRDARDTRGAHASVAAGSRDIDDKAVRVGWGSEDRAYRLGANWRGDRGLAGAPDENRLRNFSFRGDIRIDARDELELHAGVSEQSLSDGFPDVSTFLFHYRTYYSGHFQAAWRRSWGPDEELSVRVSHTRERYDDRWTVALAAPLVGIDYDFGGAGKVANLSFNHRFPLARDSRVSWGGEWRSERDRGNQIFFGRGWIPVRYLRGYGNLETRTQPDLILNAGAMLESSSETGSALMPRAMLNWLAHPEHTLRAGWSTARRAPTAFERHGDLRAFGANGALVDWSWRAHSDVRPERLHALEVGWLGEMRRLGLTADARLFRERIRDFLEFVVEPLPAGTELSGNRVNTFVNGRPLTIDGLELQARWQPREGTQFLLGQAWLEAKIGGALPASLTPAGALSVPRRAGALMWLQRLPGGLEGTLTHLYSSPVSWQGQGGEVSAWHRTDLRLAYPFRMGAGRAEASLVVQNLNDQPLRDYLPRFLFKRRAFMVLRVEL